MQCCSKTVGGSKDVQDAAATAEEDDAEANVKHGELKRVRWKKLDSQLSRKFQLKAALKVKRQRM